MTLKLGASTLNQRSRFASSIFCQCLFGQPIKLSRNRIALNLIILKPCALFVQPASKCLELIGAERANVVLNFFELGHGFKLPKMQLRGKSCVISKQNTS
jgi:hypothetical protein